CPQKTGFLNIRLSFRLAGTPTYPSPPRRAWLGMGDRNLLFAKPDRRLPSASQLPKFLEDKANRRLLLTIRSLLNAALLAANKPNRYFPQREPTLHFLLKSLARALS